MPDPTRRPVEHVVGLLRNHGCNPRQSSPTQWESRCPVGRNHKHGDRNPSLGVSEGVDGKTLIYCHGGCTVRDIAGELGLKLTDLFPDRPGAAHIEGGRRIRATYDYYDEDGTLVFQVVRYDPKDFRQRRPDGKGGWVHSIKDIQERPLYHLPQVRAAIDAGQTVWIVEGEKDAENLQWHVDGAVTTNSGGAGKWRPEYDRQLAGARDVIIIQDADGPGTAHARLVARRLMDLGARVEVRRPPNGHKDISAALAVDLGPEDCEFVWCSTEPWEAWGASDVDDASTEEHEDPDESDDVSTGWEPADLAVIWSGGYEAPKPTVCMRSDGEALFYRGRVNALNGESGGGKSWVALAACAQELAAGHHAVYVDLEDHPGSIVARLKALGVTAEQAARFTYIQPLLPFNANARELVVDLMGAADVTIVVIDSVGESMALEQSQQNDDDHVARWFRHIPRALARVNATDGEGPAVVLVDHVPKQNEETKLFAIGSQRKRAAIDGVAYRVDTVVAFSAEKAGKISLTCAKDRNGTYAKSQLVAEVHVDPHAGGGLLSIQPPAGRDETGRLTRPTVYMERISRFLEDQNGAVISRREVLRMVPGKDKPLAQALDVLEAEGYVEKQESRFGVRGVPGAGYRVVRPFRDGPEPVDNHPEGQPRPTAAQPRPTAARAAVEEVSRTAANRGPAPYVVGAGGAAVRASTDHPAAVDERPIAAHDPGDDDNPFEELLK